MFNNLTYKKLLGLLPPISFLILYFETKNKTFLIIILLFLSILINNGSINFFYSWFYLSLYFLYGTITPLKTIGFFGTIKINMIYKVFLFFPQMLIILLYLSSKNYVLFFSFTESNIIGVIINIILLTISSFIFLYLSYRY